MAIITDVEKLRPELLTKSLAELERQKAEIEMAIAQIAAKEEAAKRAKLVDEATSRVERVLDDVKWLHDVGFLPAKLTEALTRSDGQFNPATFLRAPRAEDVVTRAPGAGRKRGPRRVRDANGNLVPRSAL